MSTRLCHAQGPLHQRRRRQETCKRHLTFNTDHHLALTKPASPEQPDSRSLQTINKVSLPSDPLELSSSTERTVKVGLLNVSLQVRVKQSPQTVDEHADARPGAHHDPSVVADGHALVELDVDFATEEEDAIEWDLWRKREEW
jgi:hypothetical protein